MQLSALRTSLEIRLGVPTTDALFTTAVKTELLNEATQYIDSLFDWPWLEKEASITLVNGTKTYTVPTDWLRTLDVIVADYPPLEKVDIGRLRQMPASAGRPFFFSCFADTLEVRPVPDSGAAALATKHLYIKRETAMSADGDSPAMPDVYQWVIVEQAAYLGFRRAKQASNAQEAQANVKQWLDPWLQTRPSRYSQDAGGGVVPPPPVPVAAGNSKP